MGGRKTDLVVMQDYLNACRYIDGVLRSHIIPFSITRVALLLSNNTPP